MLGTGLRTFMCLVVALSLLAPIAPVVASADAHQKPKLAREECVRNGGWWELVTDDCEWGVAAVTNRHQRARSGAAAGLLRPPAHAGPVLSPVG